jgi:tetratricopeptide (TPR) repeat protein
VSRHLLSWAAFGLLLLASPHARADEAEDLFREGVTLYDAQSYPEAEAKFEAALAKRQSFDIAAGLGQSEEKQGKIEEAAEHYQFAVDNLPASETEQVRSGIRKLLDDIRPKVAKVLLAIGTPGATVLVDGVKRTRAGVDGDAAVFVLPGRRALRAELGKRVASKTVTVQGGQLLDMKLALPPETDDRPIEDGGPGWAIAAGVSGAFALGGFALAIGATVAHGNASDEVADHNTAIDALAPGDGGCTTPPPNLVGECDGLESALADQRTWGTLFPVGLIVGGVATAATVGFVVMHLTSSTGESAALRATPTSLELQLRF